MPIIGTKLLDLVRTIERPGSYCVGGLRDVVMPSIDVAGVGRIGFPVSTEQAAQLIGTAEAAPYGRGQETLVDRDVRRTWQVDTQKVTIGGRRWDKTLAELVAETAQALGVDDPVEAEFYKLLVYDSGSFFVDHRDTEKSPGMFATMVLVLLSAHAGGELLVRHLGQETVLDLRPDEPSQIGCTAFYSDCVHEVRPVTAGVRLTLIYNLRFTKKRRPLLAPDYRNQHGALVALLAGWGDAEDEPDKLILPLEHAYTMAELAFTALKGADAGIAGVLAQAAAEANCDLHLALVSIEESGIAEYNADYGRRRRRYYDEDDDDEDEEWEAGEITDASMTLSEWRRPDASATDLGPLPFEKGELCPPDAFEDLTPDDEHFQEATGNEGASFERSYSRAGLVLWPASRRLAVLNHGGLETTLPYLEDLVQRWQNAGKSTRPGLWAQADELSGRMLWSWSRHSWRSNNDNKPGRMLGLLCRLGNHDRIDQFLTDISAAGHYAAIDNAAILRAAALLPSERAVDRLAQIIGQNAAKSLPACSSLLRSGIELGRWGAGELAPAAATLVDKLPQDKDMVPASPWVMEPPALPAACVADLVAATSQIDPALAERALRHIMANSKQYSLDDVLVPAACALAAQEGSWIWPAAERLRGACLTHLQHRAVLPLEAPRDWARPATLGCTARIAGHWQRFLRHRTNRNDGSKRRWTGAGTSRTRCEQPIATSIW